MFFAVCLLLIGGIVVATAVIQENHELALEEEEYEMLSVELKAPEEEPESELLPLETEPDISAPTASASTEEPELSDDPEETESHTELYLLPEEISPEETEMQSDYDGNPQTGNPGKTNPGSPSTPAQQTQTG